MGTLWAIGDIHGCHTALRRLLDAIAPGPEDTLVVLGDVIDRGPDSRPVVETLLQVRETTPVIAILGNHEEMLLHARRDPRQIDRWLQEGGDATLASYSPLPDAGRLTDIPDEHWEGFFRGMAEYYESESHIFVHAGVAPSRPMHEQSASVLRWEGNRDPQPHDSGKTVIYGHTGQFGGRPANAGHAVGIDTVPFAPRGWLTALNPATGRYLQANQRGKTREGYLAEEVLE